MAHWLEQELEQLLVQGLEPLLVRGLEPLLVRGLGPLSVRGLEQLLVRGCRSWGWSCCGCCWHGCVVVAIVVVIEASVITGDSVTVLLLSADAGAGAPGVSLEFDATGVVASSSSDAAGDLHVSAFINLMLRDNK